MGVVERAMSIVAEPLFVLSAAAVLVAIFAPVLLAARKNVTHTVFYDELYEIAPEADGEDAQDEGATGDLVRVVAVELRNASGSNIERSHYTRPISMSFGKGSRILSAEVVEEVPPGIGATLRGVPEREPKRVVIEPMLLNDGDLVLLETVVSGSGRGEIEVDGRIVGVKRVAEERRSGAMKVALAVANGVVAVLVLVLGALYQTFSFVLEANELGLLHPAVLGSVMGALTGLVMGDVLLVLALYRRSRRAAWVRRTMLARHLGTRDRAG